ncbi:hypothetical protein L7F22_043346 [Adiantum nelumboides]|nr:hypothetical protein [Adiantum nelumboides]
MNSGKAKVPIKEDSASYRPIVDIPMDNASCLNDRLAREEHDIVVKNQGQTDSYWAFSTVVAVESIHQIARGVLVSLSEQQLIYCNIDNKGCSEESMPLAFDFLVSNGGLDTEEHYPYQAAQGDCPTSYTSSSSSLQDV